MDDHGPEYPRELGSAVAKYRRKANYAGSIAEMLPCDRKAYGEAVEKAIRAKQRSALQRELPSHKCSCASGTSLSDGAEISAAIRAQHRAALQASVARDRRRRTDEEWKSLYEKAMEEKRNAQAHQANPDPKRPRLRGNHPLHPRAGRKPTRSPRRVGPPQAVAD